MDGCAVPAGVGDADVSLALYSYADSMWFASATVCDY